MILPVSDPTPSGADLFLPPTYDLVWSIVVLVPIFVVFLVYGLPKLNAVLDERSRTIEEGLRASERAQEAEALAVRRAEETVAAANAEAGSIRAAASEDAKAIFAKARKEAEAEANRILELAQRQIAAERQSAQISLQSEVGLLASELAEKIVGEHLQNTDLTARVVDRFLADLESQSQPQEA
ncbi:MAG: F0F1 ATP synthase subunit B [Actinomycetaceae bacterium]|nr:F0F1 ATP synthase subunit B [Actinomycetaceae bacterium]